MNQVESKKRSKTKRWIIAGLILSPFVALALYPAPSWKTTSPDGRLSCYAAYSSFIFPDFSDGWVRVSDLKTGETVDATGIEGGVFGESPEHLIWSENGRHFIYIYIGEGGYSLHAFDVQTNPLRINASYNKKPKLWGTTLLENTLGKGNPEERERAQSFIEHDLFY